MATEAIIDSSVIVSLLIPEEFSDWSEGAIGKYKLLGTLDLAYYEVTNAIRNKVLQKELTKIDADVSLKEAVELIRGSELHTAPEALPESLSLALELRLSVYDASFLISAKRSHSRLITLDGKFAEKLKGTQYYEMVEFPTKK
jgi:predicted nucleic acid-binding protein